MKIAEIVSTFPPVLGGMGSVCFHNARELARRGHDVTVFTIQYQHRVFPDDPPGLKVVRLGSPLIYGAGGFFPQLYTRLAGFDFIHLHYPFFGAAEYVYLASLIRKQKYFLSYHCDAFGDSGPRRAIIRLYEHLLLRKILSRASGIGAVSMAHFSSSRASSLVHREKVVEIPNGVDAELFCPREKDRALVERYGLQDKMVVLFVGRLQDCKGIDVLIDALSLLRNDKIVLLVVGGGYSDERYREEAITRGVQDRVFFVGPVSHEEELPRYYNVCDLLVLPSTYMESFSLVVLEAMASAKPVVVSSLPGPSQLVSDGTDGLISRAGDSRDLCSKIEQLCDSPDKRRRMGSAGREKVLRRYDWSGIGKQLEDIFTASR
ncbi:MAG: hypothetical protein A2078_05465 [Nitrospirae bacterium GWC2_57_9]|nr:MAG: hypothetical protein A2078_05465 [Nitrospirae bacterium GWC2_57_9]